MKIFKNEQVIIWNFSNKNEIVKYTYRLGLVAGGSMSLKLCRVMLILSLHAESSRKLKQQSITIICISLYTYFQILYYSLRSATQYATPSDFGGKWGTGVPQQEQNDLTPGSLCLLIYTEYWLSFVFLLRPLYDSLNSFIFRSHKNFVYAHGGIQTNSQPTQGQHCECVAYMIFFSDSCCIPQSRKQQDRQRERNVLFPKHSVLHCQKYLEKMAH